MQNVMLEFEGEGKKMTKVSADVYKFFSARDKDLLIGAT
jgi:hypothetical protein